MQHTIYNNEKEQRFELETEGEKAFLEYRYLRNNIALMHTFVPESLNGKGLASELAKICIRVGKNS